jgi:hypothetical protein
MPRRPVLPPPPPRMIPKGRRGPTWESNGGLTEAQAAFAKAAAEGLSLTDAYRRAYSTEAMKPTTIWKNASTLANHGKVAARIEALRAENRSKTLHDAGRARDFALARLEHEANNAEVPAARIRAVELIMRHHGLLSDRPETNTADGRTAAEIRAAIQARLLSALGPVIEPEPSEMDGTAVHDGGEALAGEGEGEA